ncbi:MAG: copper resistance protein [Candidatus Binataceae bacterium]|jgi:copper resistance protein D|nr:copper resistance protein [Candidatus Binataceae bacterium]
MNMSGMDMAPEWPAAFLGWPVVLAQTLIFGSAMFCLILNWCGERRARNGDVFGRALLGWWRMLALVVALISPLMFIDEVAGMAGVSMSNALPLVGEVLAQTHAGHVWRCVLPTTFVLLLAAWLPLRQSARALSLVVLCAALCFGGSIMSHAIDFGTTAVAMRFVHALAAGAWAGALFGYWVGARSSNPENRLNLDSARLLSRLSGWSVSIMITSGIYLAFVGLGRSFNHPLYSSYGRVLAAKIEAFAIVLAIGAYNRFFLVPTIDLASTRRLLVRNVATESLIIVGVIGLAALLAATPPAHMSMTASSSSPGMSLPSQVSLSKK